MIYIYYTKAAEKKRLLLGMEDIVVFRRSKKHFQNDPTRESTKGTLGAWTGLNVCTTRASVVTEYNTYIFVWDQNEDKKFTQKIRKNAYNAQDLPIGRIVQVIFEPKHFLIKTKEVINVC